MGIGRSVFRVKNPFDMVFMPPKNGPVSRYELKSVFLSTAFGGTGFIVLKKPGRNDKFEIFTSRYCFDAGLWKPERLNIGTDTPIVTGFIIFSFREMSQSDTIRSSLKGLQVAGLSASRFIDENLWDCVNRTDGIAELICSLDDSQLSAAAVTDDDENSVADYQKKARMFYDVQRSLIEAGREFESINTLNLKYTAIKTVTQAYQDGICYDFVVGSEALCDDATVRKLSDGSKLCITEIDGGTCKGTVISHNVEAGTVRLMLHEHDRDSLPDSGDLIGIPNSAYRLQLDALERMRTDTAQNTFLERIILGESSKPIGDEIEYHPSEGVRLNERQALAVRKALNTEDFLLIQGPPGTGKTTIIIEMVRRFVESGKRVLICSQNNHAVDNVLKKCIDLWYDEEKLKKIQCLRIGSGEKVEEALLSNLRRPLTLAIQEDMHGRSRKALDEWLIAQTKRKDEIVSAQKAITALIEMLTALHGIRAMGRELADKGKNIFASLFSKGLINDVAELSKKIINCTDTISGLLLSLLFGAEGEVGEKLPQFRKELYLLEEILAYAKRINTLAQEHPIKAGLFLGGKDNIMHITKGKIPSLCETVTLGCRLLEDYRGNPNVGTLIPPVLSFDMGEEYNGLLHDYLAAYQSSAVCIDKTCLKFNEKIDEWYKVLSNDNRSIGEALLKSIKIVGGTCIGINTRDEFKPLTYDVAIVDEAGQIPMHDLLVPLAKAKKIILVGDHIQLPPIGNNDFAKYFKNNIQGELIRQYSDSEETVDEKLLYFPFSSAAEVYSKSLFEVLFRKDTKREHTVVLNEQFRMHSAISEYVSKEFYNNDYLCGTDDEEMLLPIAGFNSPLYFIDTAQLPDKGEKPDGKSCFNKNEAKVTAKCVARIISAARSGERFPHSLYDKFNNFDIGVITGYAPQIKIIKSMIEEELSKEFGAEEASRLSKMVSVNTLDSFQGMENRVIICSLVRSNREEIEKENGETFCRYDIGFMSDVRRLNVLMTRAKSLLIMIGDSETFTGTFARASHENKRAADYYKNLIEHTKEFGGYYPLGGDDSAD